MAKGLQLNEVWLERIAYQLNDMEFGSLHIVVHEGQIVQMERTERKRFENTPSKLSEGRNRGQGEAGFEKGRAGPPVAAAGQICFSPRNLPRRAPEQKQTRKDGTEKSKPADAASRKRRLAVSGLFVVPRRVARLQQVGGTRVRTVPPRTFRSQSETAQKQENLNR